MATLPLSLALGVGGNLAEAQPTFFERVVFDQLLAQPITPTGRILYSLALVAMVYLPFLGVLGMIAIWGERKIAGHIQSRLGPNRVGPFGLLQSLADGMKLIFKEDLIPADADRFLFRLAPYLAFAPVFAAFAALPFGPNMVFEPRLAAGLFWILAILSVEVMGVILAGWASNNKWSVYGAMREACQMVSYEIPLGISIIVGVMTAGTLNVVTMSHMQGGGLHTWLIYRNPFAFVAFFVFFIASLASNKRAPFDLPESESELVAGFHTEYSGFRFSVFFFAEYAAMFVIGGIQAALFLGGWHDPFGLIGHFYNEWAVKDDPMNHVGPLVLLNLIGAGIFIAKASLIMLVQMWLRWTLPRPRIDQVLYACVKVLLPLACVLLLGATLWQLFVPERAGIPWRDYEPFSWTSLRSGDTSAFGLIVQVLLTLIGLTLFLATSGWVVYSIVSGRRIKLRLTDPEPIDQAPASLVKA